ncbi:MULTISPECIES: XVIPCD domain-containing protein [Lysobacter]|uniref:XVIPCD domain-containing protein n=1 Tax=Lysobacter TaxID=68 RepID=UPI001F47FB90|nr:MULTISPECIES: XVIPCD domain-containing protein [Lysobacter]UJB19605.1 hypothetical protein L1A79_00455 [Lysobacter capsici]UJQ26669.1 hypothetical protein L2D09_14405 [Lysobacter gummosus]
MPGASLNVGFGASGFLPGAPPVFAFDSAPDFLPKSPAAVAPDSPSGFLHGSPLAVAPGSPSTPEPGSPSIPEPDEPFNLVKYLDLKESDSELDAALTTIFDRSPTVQSQIKRAHSLGLLDAIEKTGNDSRETGGSYTHAERTVRISGRILTANAAVDGSGACYLAHELQHCLNGAQVTTDNDALLDHAKRFRGERLDTQYVQESIEIARREEVSAEIAGWNALVDLAHSYSGDNGVTVTELAKYSENCASYYFTKDPNNQWTLDPEFAQLLDENFRFRDNIRPEQEAVIGRLFFDDSDQNLPSGMDYRHNYATYAIEALLDKREGPIQLDLDALGLDGDILKTRFGERRLVTSTPLSPAPVATASSPTEVPQATAPNQWDALEAAAVPTASPTSPTSPIAPEDPIRMAGAPDESPETPPGSPSGQPSLTSSAIVFDFPSAHYDHMFWGQGPNVADRTLGVASVAPVSDHMPGSPTPIIGPAGPAAAALSATKTSPPETGSVRQGKRRAEAEPIEPSDHTKMARSETATSVTTAVIGNEKAAATTRANVAALMSAAAENPIAAPIYATPQSDPLQEKIRDSVRSMDKLHNSPWDDDSERVSASALLMAERMGFKPGDTIHISVSAANGNVDAGLNLFIARSGAGASPDPQANWASMPLEDALKISADKRHEQVADVRQQQTQSSSQEQQAAMRSPDEPTKPSR